jgi:hypothetical protein
MRVAHEEIAGEWPLVLCSCHKQMGKIGHHRGKCWIIIRAFFSFSSIPNDFCMKLFKVTPLFRIYFLKAITNK